MSRVLGYPFAGAACGMLAAVGIVPIMGGGAEDTAGVVLVIGTFLAGAGAIAGAILGAAEMVLMRQEQTRIAEGVHAVRQVQRSNADHQPE